MSRSLLYSLLITQLTIQNSLSIPFPESPVSAGGGLEVLDATVIHTGLIVVRRDEVETAKDFVGFFKNWVPATRPSQDPTVTD